MEEKSEGQILLDSLYETSEIFIEEYNKISKIIKELDSYINEHPDEVSLRILKKNTLERLKKRLNVNKEIEDGNGIML